MSAWPASIDDLPAPYDAARVARLRERLAEAGVALADPRFERLVAFVAGSSPYLAQSMSRDAALLAELEQSGPVAVAEAQIAEAEAAGAGGERADLLRRLRVAKRRTALATALGDVAGAMDLDAVTGTLTRLADAALQSAFAFGLRAEAAAGRYRPADLAQPMQGSGLIVLAMGKYGAFELNYSSDIDFVVFFERDQLPVAPGVEHVPFLVRVVQSVVKALQERTGDGYVFRTDLRLRPDAGATQIAISTEAALTYYEAMGQNWERAAMIKARACAGDLVAGENFLKELRPFVWRKNLDFAAVEDIHSIKRQIHAAKGGSEVTIAGHDVKLGRGGIREIEFFAQTQQLILGGRYPMLRSRRTLDAIRALTAERVVGADAERDLSACYLYLRTLEHRLQMVADEQTHRMPEDAEARANVARFMGFPDLAAFEAKTLSVLRIVERHYAALFESSAPLAAAEGSLVFTGVDEDPETLKTLAAMGFTRPQGVSAAVRGWHHGRMAATRSARARELLTALMPALLTALGKTADPDTAFTRFDKLLHGLPAGVQLFSLIKANPWLLDVLAEICGAAPRLAGHLARTPAVLDALLDPAYLTEPPDEAEVVAAFARSLGEAPDYEAMLDAARRTARELNFRVGLQLLRGVLGPEEVGSAYATIAEHALHAVFARVRSAFETAHGKVPHGVFAIVAMGRLGARKMTAASDLDLIFLYDHDADAVSDGPSPLVPSLYFARLSQRLIAALTSLTTEGRLYEVDMRLRPSGSKGPVAVRLETFTNYHAAESWTWERMALTRSRVVFADAAFGDAVSGAIAAALAKPQDPAAIRADATAMRALLMREKPGRGIFDLKTVRGGMMDVEFIAQTHLLIAEAGHPGIHTGATQEALSRLAGAGALSGEDARALAAAYLLYTRVNHILRLTSEDDAAAVTETGLQQLLVRATGLAPFAALESALRTAQADVAQRFDRLVGPPG
ncbi:MAG: bifunctional [glutamine synthetase] adenylyltransferase/[glutamine synthetase]-adenylyl-L-tyrosine phosphorylase [Alphaproteobacteria bacterium]|nr:bifunctional [glutamine synthetase] adenylyltransferase/[glutamine synthetase]-adenylyl-L-tyrosine phosphorylase [Alphaproteobacteria bacterium]